MAGVSVEDVYAAVAPPAETVAEVADAVNVPALVCTMYDYQRRSVSWALSRELSRDDDVGVRGGVLAEEMGLGKTVEMMAIILSHRPPQYESIDRVLEQGTHPHARGQLVPQPAQDRACNCCGRRPAPQETMHFTHDNVWACCQWCLLPHLRRREDESSSSHPRDEEANGSALPPMPIPRARVRFASDDALATICGTSRSAVKEERGEPAGGRTGFKIRIKRPLADELDSCPPPTKLGRRDRGEARFGRRCDGEQRCPPSTGCTLIITPASILGQWLQELQRHSPALAARTIVYPGMKRFKPAMGVEAALRAVDQAMVMLTTYNVLKSEVWYQHSASGDNIGHSRRRDERHSPPRSLLLERNFWRIVIDEAQMVQIKQLVKGGTPRMLAVMTGRIAAQHRWCMSGTPLSPQRGLNDAFQLLQYLKCKAAVARDRAAFLEAVRRDGGTAVLALLRTVMRRTSKAMVSEPLQLSKPATHIVQVHVSCAERAWAARDAAEIGVPSELLPPPRHPAHTAEGVVERPTVVAEGRSQERADISKLFELQRALTHAQLSRSWAALGRSEAQIETGTTVVPLEQLQRAAELIQRKKQLAELELCERLNAQAALRKKLAALGHSGQVDAAVAAYQRVLRVYEWGIGENQSAGDQVDNAEETLRRWWFEYVHALFQLLCIHHDRGQLDAVETVRAELIKAEDDALRHLKQKSAAATHALSRYRREQLLPVLQELADVWAEEARERPPASLLDGQGELTPQLEAVLDDRSHSTLELLQQAGLAVDSSAHDGGGSERDRTQLSPSGVQPAPALALHDESATIEWLRALELVPPSAWLRRVERATVVAREEARASFVAAQEQVDGAPSLRNSHHSQSGTPGFVSRAPASSAGGDHRELERPPRRARGSQTVLEYWDAAKAEEKRCERERRARAEALAQMRSHGGWSALQARKRELKLEAEAEVDALSVELQWLRQHLQPPPARHRDDEAQPIPQLAGRLYMHYAALLTVLKAECELRLEAEKAPIDEEEALMALEDHKLSHPITASLETVEEPGRAEDGTGLPSGLATGPRSCADGDGVTGSDTMSEAALLQKKLRELESWCAKQTESCLSMEAQVKELYRQRLAECLADRNARRPSPAGLNLVTRNIEWAVYISSLPPCLQAFVVPPASQKEAHARAAEVAAHSCAVTLTLRLAFQEWLWDRIAHAEPPGSFHPSDALLGASPTALAHKLDAVRFCAAAASLGTRRSLERVAQWLLRELPEAGVVPCAELPYDSSSRYSLPDGQSLSCITCVEDRKRTIFDGEVMVEGKLDGEVSGASYESGPWVWEAAACEWTRDVHPHEVLVSTPCGHAYAELFWSDAISTSLEQADDESHFSDCSPVCQRNGRWRARKAKCCAPIAGGGQCGRPLVETQGLRITACRPRVAQGSLHQEHDHHDETTVGPRGFDHVELSSLPFLCARGAWGSRIEQTIRLLLSLLAAARAAGNLAHSKTVIFSRFELVQKLLQHACQMNGIRCASYDASAALIERFRVDETLQVLLLSAQRDASGLTLTAASHVVIMEPQPDVAVEMQMIGRVHRIGQLRQTHVYRMVVGNSFEVALADERSARESSTAA